MGDDSKGGARADRLGVHGAKAIARRSDANPVLFAVAEEEVHEGAMAAVRVAVRCA